jgi:hypothetical protein
VLNILWFLEHKRRTHFKISVVLLGRGKREYRISPVGNDNHRKVFRTAGSCPEEDLNPEAPD